MSLQTQAILPGHLTAAEIAVQLTEASNLRFLGYRNMRIPDHVLFEFEGNGNEILCFEAFLNSWAADDYADILNGASTMLTAAYSLSAIATFRRLLKGNGFMRHHELCEWQNEFENNNRHKPNKTST